MEDSEYHNPDYDLATPYSNYLVQLPLSYGDYLFAIIFNISNIQ